MDTDKSDEIAIDEKLTHLIKIQLKGNPHYIAIMISIGLAVFLLLQGKTIFIVSFKSIEAKSI